MTCNRRNLQAFLDDELSGEARAQMARHIDTCPRCAAEAESIAEMGEALRLGVATRRIPAELAHLASSVVTQTRAERAQSWRAAVERTFEDAHHLLVAAGSLTAACASVLFVAALLHFGPAPERDDSLSAMFDNQRDLQRVVASPSGALYVWASPTGAQGRTRRNMGPDVIEASPAVRIAAERRLVEALAVAITREGHAIDLDTMSEPDRHQAEQLLYMINRLRDGDPISNADVLVPQVYRVQFVTSSSVTAKGL